MRRFAGIFAALFWAAISMNAAVIYIDSSAASTTNNSGHSTVNISPYPAWDGPLAGSQWISYGSTGDPNAPGYFVVPNGTMVTFTITFDLTGAVTAGVLDVLADDSTSVVLNGNSLIGVNTTKGPHCALGPIGCLTSTEGIFTLATLAPWLVEGTNTLQFGVEQINGYSFGLDFAGSFTTDPAEALEPATLAMIGSGLFALVALRRRR